MKRQTFAFLLSFGLLKSWIMILIEIIKRTKTGLRSRN